MWQVWVFGGGLSSLIVSLSWIVYKLHRDAVEAERGRADDWRAAAMGYKATAEAADKRADIREQQLATLIASALSRQDAT